MKNRIRIIRLFFSFIVMSTLLVSCINRKNQFFTEGIFTGIYDDISYYLEINRITDEEYMNAKGINVVEDVVLTNKDNKFKIKLYYYEDNQILEIDFKNLRDDNPNSKAQPINYVDDNSWNIAPLDRDNHQYIYVVSYYDKIIYFK